MVAQELAPSSDKRGALNIVFVPSAFRGDKARWREKAEWFFSGLKIHSILDANEIDRLNVLYVTVCRIDAHPMDNPVTCLAYTERARERQW